MTEETPALSYREQVKANLMLARLNLELGMFDDIEPALKRAKSRDIDGEFAEEIRNLRKMARSKQKPAQYECLTDCSQVSSHRANAVDADKGCL